MSNVNRVFVTGDRHGDFSWLPRWCEENQTTTNDILIILGDSGLRFEGANKWREQNRKKQVAAQPITVFCVRGNHDRPFDEGNVEDVILETCPLLDKTFHDAYGSDRNMWHDSEYPNIWYFNEVNPVCYIKGNSFCILPGAYSVDKEYRLLMGWTWYENEQLSRDSQLDYLDQIYDRNFDFVLSHTCPYEWRPTDLFLSGIDQSKVDTKTEDWLSDVKNYIGYGKWFFGHYHNNRDYGNVGDYDWHGETTMLYDEIRRIL